DETSDLPVAQAVPPNAGWWSRTSGTLRAEVAAKRAQVPPTAVRNEVQGSRARRVATPVRERRLYGGGPFLPTVKIRPTSRRSPTADLRSIRTRGRSSSIATHAAARRRA